MTAAQAASQEYYAHKKVVLCLRPCVIYFQILFSSLAEWNTDVGPTGKQFDETKKHFVLSGDEACVSLMPSEASAGLFLQAGLGE